MHLIRSVDDLRLTLRATVVEQDCQVRDVDVEQAVAIERLRLARLDMNELSIDGALILRDCEIDSVVLQGCVAERFLLTDCRIGKLVLRHLPPNANVALSGGEYWQVALRDVGPVSVYNLICQRRMAVSGLRGDLLIGGLDARDLLVTEHLSANDSVDLKLSNSRIRDELELRDLHLARLHIEECRISSLRFRRLVVDAGTQIRRLYCSNQALVDSLSVTTAVEIAQSDLSNGLEMLQLHTADNALTTIAKLINTRVIGALRISSDHAKHVIVRDTNCELILFPDRSPRYQIEGTSTVSEVELPLQSMITNRQVKMFVSKRFQGNPAASFAVVRRSLGASRRVREEDVCYYLQRNAEVQHLRPVPRLLTRLVLAGVLGWGVRILPPLRALAAGIGGTAGVLYLLRQPRGAYSLSDTVSLSAALWLNVGTGIPQTLLSGAWAAVASALAAAGVVLITVTVGIAIRRLVR